MPRTAGGLRTDPTARLADLERQRPEWQAWLRLLAETERTAADTEWSAALDSVEPASGPSADAPLLHGRTLRVDATQVQRLLGRLAMTASASEGGASLRSYRPPADEALRLLAAAVRHDSGEITQVAAVRKLDPGALASVTYLAALPLLRQLRRTHEDRIPQHWPHGYCPVCAAWAIFTERRGLDRSRRLRCGRCAAEWEVEWLYCVYCNERNHEQLGALQPEGRGEILKVETCATCMGYLKSLASLQGFPEIELLLQDLETVELDLVALERGYRRPSQTGFPLNTHITGDAPRNRL